MTEEKLQSQTIDYLRFPLIVAVVFIHSYSSVVTIEGVDIGVDITYPIFDNFRYFISVILAAVAVPLFFFISGFLFFFKINSFNLDVYANKIKKRFHSLVIPYIFWNVLTLFVLFIAHTIPPINSLFSGEKLSIIDYSLSDFFKAFWGGADGVGFPILITFWFIRDLIIIVLFSPLVYFSIRYLQFFPVLLLFFVWFLRMDTTIGFSSVCWFFFSAGAYFSINKLNLVSCFHKISLVTFVFYPIIVVLDLLTKEFNFNIYIHKIGIILGILFLFNFISKNLSEGKLNTSQFLSNASFFVFAIHEPWLTFIRKILFKILNPNSELSYIFAYFIPPLTIIIIALLMYYILERIIPQFLKIITGGR